MTQYPTSFGMLLGAYERALTPPVEVAIVGPDPALRTAWARRVTAHGVGVRSPTGAGDALSPLLDGPAVRRDDAAPTCASTSRAGAGARRGRRWTRALDAVL